MEDQTGLEAKTQPFLLNVAPGRGGGRGEDEETVQTDEQEEHRGRQGAREAAVHGEERDGAQENCW